MTADKQERRFVIEWHYANRTNKGTVTATDQAAARRQFRASTRHLGYGVTIVRITVHPEDRKPSVVKDKA